MMLKMLKKKMKMLKMMLEGRPFGLSSDSESFTLVGEIGFLPVLTQVGHEDLYWIVFRIREIYSRRKDRSGVL